VWLQGGVNYSAVNFSRNIVDFGNLQPLQASGLLHLISKLLFGRLLSNELGTLYLLPEVNTFLSVHRLSKLTTMPHTNRKKPKSSLSSNTPSKPKIVQTKRQQIEDDEGWTHIIDTPRKPLRAPQKENGGGLVESTAKQFHSGDFVVNGVAYVNRTLEELVREAGTWEEAWRKTEACLALETILKGEDQKLVEGEEEGKEDAQIVKEESNDKKQRSKIDSVVCLGLGSLQNARREGRRASFTQLAALKTIISSMGMFPQPHYIMNGQLCTKTNDQGLSVPCVLQDPQFTALDKEFLTSLGYEVLSDPDAFARIMEGTLVYAIHCYADVYRTVNEGVKPRVLVGTDVQNFGRFSL